jgi:hypothetical protein
MGQRQRPRQLSPVEAHEAIQEIISSDGVSFSRHVVCESGPSRHIDADDILKVLQDGMVSSNAEWDEIFQQWKYRVSGRDYDSDPLVVIVALDPAFNRLTVITAYGN